MKCQHMTCYQCEDEETAKLRDRLTRALDLLEDTTSMAADEEHPTWIANRIALLKECGR